jgi:serine/threonine protein kinase
MEELIGKDLGPYRIEAKIGQGAMAAVFKAYQLSLDRYVAIKVMPPSFAAKNPVFVKRFQREAKAIARLHHPNILPVYDFGVDRDYSYIVMRYVEGAQTLNRVIYHLFDDDRKFDLIIQTANALAYAHKHGVVHRDVKPSNILLDEGWALLSDFGLAKVGESASRLTGTGRGIGTPAYMSPEQARGEVVDHRADIYALGVILYEMLTQSIPHDADTPLGIMLKRVTEPTPSPRQLNPAISERLEQVVLRALAFNREDRFNSAEHFGTALKSVITEQPYRTPSSGSLTRATGALASQPITGPDPQAKTLPEKALKSKLPRSTWLAGLAVVLPAIALVLWGGSLLGLGRLQPTPAEAASPIVAVPTSTPTPTQTPTSTATNTPTSPPPTPSPQPTQTPTNTPEPPTATPLVIVVTATATSTPTTEPTATPVVPTATPTITPTPTSSLPKGTFVLLKPASLDEPSYGLTDFEWEWQGALPPEFGFEVRVWREGEPLAGAHDAVLDNQQGRIEQFGPNKYRLRLDIRQAAGVRGRTGEYLWTVALVQISPGYADLAQQAEPIRLRFEAGGSSSNGGDDKGGQKSEGGGIS